MVNLLLCKSPLVQNTVTAAAEILGGIGQSFMQECRPTRHVPTAIIHGETDPVIGYYNPTMVDGSMFASTCKFKAAGYT
jgi:hypothetical protein